MNPHQAKVRVALIGCGAVARLYYRPALRELERRGMLDVAALVDPVAAHAEALRVAFPRAATLRETTEIPSDGVDLAIVSSPHSRHAAQAIQLLDAGISVLCEKPMATAADDARAMSRAAAASGALLAIGLVRRFFPSTQMVRQLLSLRMLGEITSFSFSEGSAAFEWPAASGRYFDRREVHGGVLMDIGAHALDLLQWWLGVPSIVGYCDDAMGGIEANCTIRCRLPDGPAGTVRLSRDCALDNRYTIRGTRGWLSWEAGEARHIDLGFADSAQRVRASASAEAEASFERAFLDQLMNVVTAMHGTEALKVPAAEGVPSVELVEQCYRNRSLMPMPWLDDRELARARELGAAKGGGAGP